MGGSKMRNSINKLMEVRAELKGNLDEMEVTLNRLDRDKYKSKRDEYKKEILSLIRDCQKLVQ
jgi:predicted phage gp36 major capsid-like protein